jgi:outer membrane lipoprotein-sorting protein
VIVYGLVVSLFLSSSVAVAADPALPTAAEVLKRIDQNMTFESRTMTITMTSMNPRRTRSFTMKAWGRGEDTASIEYTEPVRDAGTRMLRMADELWMYMPAVEKTQKISGHMLRQGMMGSDVSYEDMMAAGDLETDYTATVLGLEDCGASSPGRKCYKVEMIAKNAEITYPKRITLIDSEYYIAVRQEMYAVSGLLLKTWEMTDIQSFNDGQRWFPTKMTITDKLQEGTSTTLVFKDLVFGAPIEDEVFTTRWLERK